MTSKEALERLGSHCNEYQEARWQFQNEYEQIAHDLEVLEILKKYLSIKSFTPCEYPELIILSGGEIKDIENAFKIREWLENDE